MLYSGILSVYTKRKNSFDLTVPIFDDSETPLAALLRTDPDIFLYPFIQTWPTLSESAETLIFRQNGQEIVFLVDFAINLIPLKTCIPLTKLIIQQFKG